MRKLPPLGTLPAFEAAARHLSFKAAAEELGLTPTAISHQVRLLEDYCGEKLFRRRPRPLALTWAGAKLLPAVRDGFDEIARALAALGGANSAPLRVTTTNAFASRWLVPRLSLWRTEHDDVALSVIGTDRVLRLDAGESDLAIRYARSPPPGCCAPEIFRDRYFPVCSPKLLADGAPLRLPSDLARYPLIHFDWFADDREAPSWERWLAMAAATDPEARRVDKMALSFREELHAIDAVLAGQGIAICSDIVVADDLASGALVKVLNLALPGYGFYPVYALDHPRRAIIDAFVAWLASVARLRRAPVGAMPLAALTR